ncbi:putative aldo-keto reductase [Xylariales sp. PMI_506]|nr:putative aldo-keto reductase [Xylariales sp. PMI_506]
MAIGSTPVRTLGKNGPRVPALGFGLMGLSNDQYGSLPDDEERFAILDRAVELGATFWDTADLYGDGEEFLGKWFKRTGKRDKIFLATKFGYVKGSKTYETDSSAAYCKKACADSLKRLGVDYIDLYYVHNVSSETPIEETMRALVELQQEGKIRHIGLSTVSSNTLRRAAKIGTVAAMQSEYSVFNRAIDTPAGTNLLSTIRELGVALVVSSPLGRGLATTTFSNNEALGDAKDTRTRSMPRLQEANRAHNVDVISRFRVLADRKGCTVSQLTLAWILKQGDFIIPLPGTKKRKYLEENWAALQVQLSDKEEAEITAFAEAADIAGPVVPPGFESYIFRDTKEETA